MEPSPRAISWEAPQHSHTDKSSDWYFAFVIIVLAVVVSAIIFGNPLFALVLAVGGVVLLIAVARRPSIITYAVSVRGVTIDEEFYPFSELLAYYIDETDHKGPQLLLLSKRTFMPHIIMTLPEDYIDDVEDIIREKLPEEHLEEPFLTKVLEILGF
jgi:hypothetical protein